MQCRARRPTPLCMSHPTYAALRHAVSGTCTTGATFMWVPYDTKPKLIGTNHSDGKGGGQLGAAPPTKGEQIPPCHECRHCLFESLYNNLNLGYISLQAPMPSCRNKRRSVLWEQTRWENGQFMRNAAEKDATLKRFARHVNH